MTDRDKDSCPFWEILKQVTATLYGMTASVIGDERLWGWQIAGPSVRSMSPHTLLHWDSFKWAIARELAYDMGGVPHEGIRVIKQSLGAELETIVGGFQFHPGAAYKADLTASSRKARLSSMTMISSRPAANSVMTVGSSG